MSFFKNIQNKLGAFLGGQDENQNRQKGVYNYEQANSLALIFKLEDENQYKVVREYLKFVKDEHHVKELMALCFVDDKEVPQYIQSRVDFDFFTRKDVNWQQKTSNTTVDNFVEAKYDILIDLSSGESPVINGITKMSCASFKIGKNSKKNAVLYDFMLDLSSDHSLKAYLKQVNHYLTVINKKA